MTVKKSGDGIGGAGLIKQIRDAAGEAGKKVADARKTFSSDAILASLPDVPKLTQKTVFSGQSEALGDQFYGPTGADADVGTEQARDASPMSFLINSKMTVPSIKRWKQHDARVAKWLDQLGTQGEQLLESFTGGSKNPNNQQLAAATEALGILATQIQGSARVGSDAITDFFRHRAGDIDLLAKHGFNVLKARKDTAQALAES